MSGLFRAMAEIQRLAAQADVHGVPRVSITFDRPTDRERFLAEVKRQLQGGEIAFGFSGPLNFSECTIHGVKVRII